MRLASPSMKLRITYALGAAALIALCLSGCGKATLAGKWEYTEVKRIRAPDSLVDAVIAWGTSGATDPGTTYVYLVPAGDALSNPGETKPVFEAEYLKGFKVQWTGRNLLEIGYEKAMISSFMNYWYSRKVEKYRHVVEVRLEPARPNVSALPAEIKDWYNE
jgi:hypothetical protein